MFCNYNPYYIPDLIITLSYVKLGNSENTGKDDFQHSNFEPVQPDSKKSKTEGKFFIIKNHLSNNFQIISNSFIKLEKIVSR